MLPTSAATATSTPTAAGTVTWFFASRTATPVPGTASAATMIVVPGPMISLQRYEYTGRELASESAEYYFRYRVYGPALGQFFTRDPLGYEDGMGLYGGVFARVGQTDPSGRQMAAANAAFGPQPNWHPIPQTPPPHCCDRKHFDPSTQSCCDGKVITAGQEGDLVRSWNKSWYTTTNGAAKCCNIRVTFRCRNIDLVLGAGHVLPGKHCYLLIERGTATGGWSTLSSLSGTNGDGQLNGKTVYQPGLDLAFVGKWGDQAYSFSHKKKNDCDFAACAEKWAKALDGQYPYSNVPPNIDNSNTFQARILRNCGGTATFPATGIGETIPQQWISWPY